MKEEEEQGEKDEGKGHEEKIRNKIGRQRMRVRG